MSSAADGAVRPAAGVPEPAADADQEVTGSGRPVVRSSGRRLVGSGQAVGTVHFWFGAPVQDRPEAFQFSDG